MKKKMKVAILEDNAELLKNLKLNIEETELADVLICCTNSTDFIQQVRSREIDTIILDIELDGENINGIDVANILKMPVLFVSGKSKDFLEGIETINLDYDFPVESIQKPASSDKFKKILTKLFDQIRWIKKDKEADFVFIKSEGMSYKVDQNNIVFIESIADGSNNKTIYLVNSKPIILFNFTFSKMFEKGYDTELFCQPHQSYRVNKNRISTFNNANSSLTVSFQSESGCVETKEIPISEYNIGKIKNLFNSKTR